MTWERCSKGPLKALHLKTSKLLKEKLQPWEIEKLNELSEELWERLSKGKSDKEKDFILRVMLETILIVAKALDKSPLKNKAKDKDKVEDEPTEPGRRIDLGHEDE